MAPPSEAMSASATGAPTPSGTTGSQGFFGRTFGQLGRGLNATNKMLGEYQPLIDLAKQGIGSKTPQQQQLMQFQLGDMAAMPAPPSPDRLAFLRAFGIQG